MANKLEDCSAIAPHNYPLWIMLFAAAIICMLFYSALSFPRYYTAMSELKSAEHFYKLKNYSEAIRRYRNVLDIVPTSDNARIGAAEAIFANSDKSDDGEGLALLQNIKLNKSRFARISKVMPSEYQQYFKNSKR